MMRIRVAVLAALIVRVLLGGIGADAQDDDPEATIAALQTRVAELEATVEARGEKINAQRTQIAELRGAQATLTPTPTALYFDGSGNAEYTVHLTAGVHVVEVRVGGYGEVRIDVYDPDGRAVRPSMIMGPHQQLTGSYTLRVSDDGDYTIAITSQVSWTVDIAE
jgi:hypothetical protein